MKPPPDFYGFSTFDEFLARYGGYIRVVMRKSLRNREDVEDVMQEIRLRLFKGRQRFDPLKSSLGTWIGLITRGAVIDFTRRQKTWNKSINSIRPFAQEMSHDNIKDLEAITKVVDRVTKSLPEKDKEVFFLKEGRSLSTTDIQSFTGQPLGTVKSKLFRVQRTLAALTTEKDSPAVN